MYRFNIVLMSFSKFIYYNTFLLLTLCRHNISYVTVTDDYGYVHNAFSHLFQLSTYLFKCFSKILGINSTLI